MVSEWSPRSVWERTRERAWARECPRCRAPAGMPCLDLRSFDLVLYGNRTHRERQEGRP